MAEMKQTKEARAGLEGMTALPKRKEIKKDEGRGGGLRNKDQHFKSGC